MSVPAATRQPADPWSAMGHPIAPYGLALGLEAVRAMMPGIGTEAATGLVGAVAANLERDDPYRAMAAARERGLDVTGTYRLLATLLAHAEGATDG